MASSTAADTNFRFAGSGRAAGTEEDTIADMTMMNKKQGQSISSSTERKKNQMEVSAETGPSKRPTPSVGDADGDIVRKKARTEKPLMDIYAADYEPSPLESPRPLFGDDDHSDEPLPTWSEGEPAVGASETTPEIDIADVRPTEDEANLWGAELDDGPNPLVVCPVCQKCHLICRGSQIVCLCGVTFETGVWPLMSGDDPFVAVAQLKW